MSKLVDIAAVAALDAREELGDLLGVRARARWRGTAPRLTTTRRPAMFHSSASGSLIPLPPAGSVTCWSLSSRGLLDSSAFHERGDGLMVRLRQRLR